MKKFVACLMADLPETVIPKRRVSICYGYSIWKEAVGQEIAQGEVEVERFKQMESPRIVEVQESLDSHRRLLAFMSEHGLDVIFRDLEQEGA